MRTRSLTIVAGTLLALAMALALPTLTWARGPGGGPGRGTMGGQQQSLVAVAAQVLGMTQDELLAELQAGKTIKDVAGSRADAIVDAFVKPRADRLAAMVAAGRITQAEADQMLATMRANVADRLDDPWAPRGAGGAGYVDANGDGVCDGAGMGPGMQRGAGRGRMGGGR